jgi:hypothetical protein
MAARTVAPSKYLTRKSPPVSATDYPDQVLPGNDGQMYISTKVGAQKAYTWKLYTGSDSKPIATPATNTIPAMTVVESTSYVPIVIAQAPAAVPTETEKQSSPRAKAAARARARAAATTAAVSNVAPPPAPGPSTCTSCGTACSATSNFCSNCGLSLKTKAVTASDASTAKALALPDSPRARAAARAKARAAGNKRSREVLTVDDDADGGNDGRTSAPPAVRPRATAPAVNVDADAEVESVDIASEETASVDADTATSVPANPGFDPKGHFCVFTGFRDAAMEAAIRAGGGSVIASVTRTATCVIAAEGETSTQKYLAAQAKGLPIFPVSLVREALSLTSATTKAVVVFGGPTNAQRNAIQAAIAAAQSVAGAGAGATAVGELIDTVAGKFAAVPVKAMLAERYDKCGPLMRFPAFAQPKLDGERAMYASDCTLTARSGKPVNGAATLIRTELAKTNLGGLILDGELYIHGMSFQQVQHRIRSNDPALEYWVYDVLLDAPYEKRKQVLDQFFKDNQQHLSKVKLVPTVSVASADAVMPLHNEIKAGGYEGIILRNASAKYVGKRTRDLQKVKAFEDDEFVVVGWETSTIGGVLWVCQVRPGVTFTVKPTGSNVAAIAAVRTAKSRIGQKYTVQHFGFTDEGKPRMPIGVGFRDAADLGAPEEEEDDDDE